MTEDLRKQITYKGHAIFQYIGKGLMEDRYWHYQPLPGKTGVSGKVYASVKETKRAIDAGLKRLEREAREAAKKQRVRERPRKIKG